MSTEQRHPRDAYVLYQEQLQRSNEGDIVDMTAYQKVKVELQHLDANRSTATVQFFHEDHTLGNSLRHTLMQLPQVATAGYSIPHPLEPRMLVHVQAEDYAVDVVEQGLLRLAEICDVTLKSFEKAHNVAMRGGK